VAGKYAPPRVKIPLQTPGSLGLTQIWPKFIWVRPKFYSKNALYYNENNEIAHFFLGLLMADNILKFQKLFGWNSSRFFNLNRIN